MRRPLPGTPAEWFKEIQKAVADAKKTRPFGWLFLHRITDANLFHLAPLICLKFRGRQTRGPEAKRVIGTALANHVANADNHGLKSRPVMAFVLCYIGAASRPRPVERTGSRGYPGLLRRELG